MAAAAFLARMLDANEQRPAVCGPGDTRYLALPRADQEAADLAGLRIADEHLVVAHAGEIALVRVVAICLDPKQTVFIEGDPVGRIEHVAGVDVLGARKGV